MVVDISKITLENIDDYICSAYEEQYIAQKGRKKFSSWKEYNHWYYLTKTKEKRKQKRLLEKNKR